MMMLIVVAVVGVVLMAVVDNMDIIRAAVQKTAGTYTPECLLTQSNTFSTVDLSVSDDDVVEAHIHTLISRGELYHVIDVDADVFMQTLV